MQHCIQMLGLLLCRQMSLCSPCKPAISTQTQMSFHPPQVTFEPGSQTLQSKLHFQTFALCGKKPPALAMPLHLPICQANLLLLCPCLWRLTLHETLHARSHNVRTSAPPAIYRLQHHSSCQHARLTLKKATASLALSAHMVARGCQRRRYA